MAQTVTSTQTTTLADGTVYTVVTYSDGSKSETWTPVAGTAAANAQTLRDRSRAALGTNATYLALASPSTAQNTAQVKALTRQVDGIIRLLVVNDTSAITDS